jgi:hypothetical protein
MIIHSKIYPLIVTAIVFAVAMFLKNGVGALTPFSDGGSHYVTGLLAFDWLHAQHLSNPIQFGTEYFKHYPYIGLLLWPPLFYGLEMVAFSLFGPSIQVAMGLANAIFAGGAVLLGYAVWKSGRNALVAHCVVAAVLTSTLVQEVQRNLLIDGLVSVLSLAATLQFALYVKKPLWRGAMMAGLWAILAFYAKGNALQLGLAFPLVALLLRQPGVLIDRRTLAMAFGCAIVTGPWLYLTAGLSAQGFLYSPGIKALFELTVENLRTLFFAMPVLAPFACIGALKVIHTCAKPEKLTDPAATFNAACFALTVGSLCFHAALAVATDPRYMLSALLGAFGLAVSGVDTVVRWLATWLGQGEGGSRHTLGIAAVLAVQVIVGVTTPLGVIPDGAASVAASVFKSMPDANRSVLISGDHNVETSVGPALAQLDGSSRASANGIVVVRGSRAFAGGGYRNRDYAEKFKGDLAYREEIRRLGVPVIVTSTAQAQETWGHVPALQRILADKNSNYVKVSVVPFFRQQEITIWRLKDEFVKPIDFESVSASNTLRERLNKTLN